MKHKYIGGAIALVLLAAIGFNTILLSNLSERFEQLEIRYNGLETQFNVAMSKLSSLTSTQDETTTILKGMGGYNTPEADDGSTLENWKIPTKWKSIEKGQIPDQVIAILGKPTSKKKDSDSSFLFYYTGFSKEHGDLTWEMLFVDGKVDKVQITGFKPKRS